MKPKFGQLPTISEAVVKKSITEYLNLQEKMGKCYFVRNNSFAGRLLDKLGRMHYVQQGKTGSPDIIALIGGKFVGIEVKSSIGKMSDEQKQAQVQIEKLGGIYRLARSIDDIADLFMETI